MQFTLYRVEAYGKKYKKWRAVELTKVYGALVPKHDVVILPDDESNIEKCLLTVSTTVPVREIVQLWVVWKLSTGDYAAHQLENWNDFEAAADYSIDNGYDGFIYDGAWVTRRFFNTDKGLRRYLQRACPDYLPDTLRYVAPQY